MPTLSSYTNVYNTALIVLQEKGFQFWFDEASDCYCAERDGWDFVADTPCELLGLVAIFEAARPQRYAEYWWRKTEPKLYEGIATAPQREYRSRIHTDRE